MKDKSLDMRWMWIVFYAMVWVGATGEILGDLLDMSDGFGQIFFAWVFSIVVGGAWPMMAGALLMNTIFVR